MLNEEDEKEPLLPELSKIKVDDEPEVDNNGKQSILAKKQITLRHWGLLLFACLLLFGNYYCYDIPASLNVPIKKWLGSDYQQWQWQINLLYSVYSLPNVFLPVFGGILVDILGLRTMLLLFSVLCCTGQAIFSLGLSGKMFPLMVAGRFVFGLGGESLEVAQAKVTTDWFHGRGLAFALGMNVAFARIATALNDNLSPVLSALVNTGFASWIGFVVCSLSMISAIGIIWLDSDSSKAKAGLIDSPQHTNNDDENAAEDDGELEEDEDIHWTQILQFPNRFWILCLCTISMYGAASPFFHVCTDFFMYKWNLELQEAGMIMSIPDILAAVFSPIFGYAVDKVGHRGSLLPVAGILLLVTHSLLTFTHIYPAFPMALMGLAYALFAAVLWPCVPLLVRMHQIATGFGVLTISLNIALSVFPLLVATVRSSSVEKGQENGNWDSVGYFFILQSVLSTIFAVFLRVLDYRYGGSLLETSSKYTPLSQDDDFESPDDEYGDDNLIAENDARGSTFLQIPVAGEDALEQSSPVRGRSPRKPLSANSPVVLLGSPSRYLSYTRHDDDGLVVAKVLGQANTILVPRTFAPSASSGFRNRRKRTRSAGPLRRKLPREAHESIRPRSTSPIRNPT